MGEDGEVCSFHSFILCTQLTIVGDDPHLQLVGSVEVLESDSDTLRHGLLTGTDPHSGVVVLLVWLVVAIWVAHLRADVVLLRDHVVADALSVCVLQIGVEVDLDHTVADGIQVVLLARARAAVEDQEDWLLLLGVLLLLHVFLVLLEQLWPQLDVAWLVDTVDVAETSSDREVWRDWCESLVDLVDVLWLCVEGVVVHILIVDTVLLATSDTNLHLEELLHGCGTLEVGSSGLEVLLDRFLGQIDHVRGEEGHTVGLEELLVLVEHAVQPWEQLLGAVICVEDDWNAVGRSDGADVVCSGNGTSNGRFLVLVAHALAGKVGSSALGHLEDDGRLCIAGCLEGGHDGGGGSDVDGGNGKLLLLCVLEEVLHVI